MSMISKSERVHIGKIQISRQEFWKSQCQYNWKCGRYSPLKRIAAESVISSGEFRYAVALQYYLVDDSEIFHAITL